MAPLIVLLLLARLVHRADLDLNGHIVEHSCEQTVCVHVWSTGNVKMAIVTDGRMLANDIQGEESKCRMSVRSFSTQGGFCATDPCVPGQNCAPFTPVVNRYPRRSTSLQCVLLSSLARSTCFTSPRGQLEVQWTHENGRFVEEGPEYGISQNLPCDLTLTVSLRSPRNVTFTCLARVQGRRLTSESVSVRLPPLRGKGRVIKVPQPGDERAEAGGPSVLGPSVVGPTVAVLCAVLVVAAALFVLNKRRTNARRSSESHTSAADYVLDPEEVVYADVVFLASSDRVCAPASEPTVYACVR